jgi:hypothetical protein
MNFLCVERRNKGIGHKMHQMALKYSAARPSKLYFWFLKTIPCGKPGPKSPKPINLFVYLHVVNCALSTHTYSVLGKNVSGIWGKPQAPASTQCHPNDAVWHF